MQPFPQLAGIARERWVPEVGVNLYNRLQFAGQFWVGIAAWPALLQYARYDETANDPRGDPLFGWYQRMPPEEAINAVQTAGKTLRDLRVGEVSRLDVTIDKGKVTSYRARVNVSFKYER